MAKKYSTTELRNLAGAWLEDKNDTNGMTLSEGLDHFLNFISVTTLQSEEKHARAHNKRKKETAGR